MCSERKGGEKWGRRVADVFRKKRWREVGQKGGGCVQKEKVERSGAEGWKMCSERKGGEK